MTDITQLLACATCRVDPGSAINQAANGAVFVMLGFMAVVFSGFLAMVLGFVRRQRAMESAAAAAAAGLPPEPPAGGATTVL